MTTTQAAKTVHVFQVYIQASPQAIWDAITKPEWTQRYGYRGIADYDLRPGGAYKARATEEFQAMGMPEEVVDGEVIEVDPPHKLVQTWRFLWDDAIKAEVTRVSFEIEGGETGVSRLTVTHELENAPLSEAQFTGQVEGAGGGWPFVLSDLKTLLETGQPLPG